MDALQEMRGGDVGHVEGWVLAEQHDIHGRKIDTLGRAEFEMIALHVAQQHRLDGGVEFAVAEAQPLGRIVKKLVATRLRLKAHGEGGIACDIDARDMVHLDRYVLDLGHFRPSLNAGQM